MAHGGEFAGRLPADALRRGVGEAQIGMRLFQALELGQEVVVFPVGDGRSGQDVVVVVVFVELFGQFGDAGCGVGGHGFFRVLVGAARG